MKSFKDFLGEAEKQRLDPKCWKGYKKQGTKVKGGVRVNNCVPEETDGGDFMKRRAAQLTPQEKKKANDNYKQQARAEIKKKMQARFGEGAELKYCPKCKKLETRSDCAFGGEYWDNNAKEVTADDNGVSLDEAKKGYKPPKKSNLTAKMFRKMAGFHEEKGMEGMTQKGGHKRSTESGAGLTQKGVEKYRRQNPGSKLQTAVTTPPSKLKPGSKAAKRRKSFCARSRGWTGERGKAARRRWNC